MFDTDSDDEDLLSSPGATQKIPVSAVAQDEEALHLLQKLEGLGSFSITNYEHDAVDHAAAQGIGIFHIRMLEAFDDLGRIRAWRNARPLQPIIALSDNDDEDFMLEAFKSGVTNYLSPHIPAAVLAEILRSYYKMSEAPRLVEIQNAEMIRSMQAEREATEARMAAEGAKALAQAQAAANQRTKEILDNLTEGFFIVEKDLSIADVTSKSCLSIFGQNIAGMPLGEVLGLADGREIFLRGGLEQVFDDFMPLEVNISLLPKRVKTLDGRTLSLDFHPILDASRAPEKVIIAAMDVTADVRTQEHLERLRAESETLLRILSEREAFGEFLTDSKRDLAELRETDSLNLGKRILHTLKGNASVMGLSAVAELIHGLETELETKGELAFLGDYALRIEQAFIQFLDAHKTILQIDWLRNDSQVAIHRHDVTTLLDYVRGSAGEGRETALRLLEDTRLRTVQSMLAGFSEIALQLGQKLGKEIEFQLIGGDLKLDPEVYGPLMKSLVHALRNACDHGIEDPEERERLGKPGKGVITFRFEPLPDGKLRVTLADTGRGIQLQKLLKKALSVNIVKETELGQLRVMDVLHLVFHDGLSTADAISETSGRGVGMACIRQEVEALGGKIRIASKPEKGTIFELNLPFLQAG